MGCASSGAKYTNERQVLEAERRALEAEKRAFEAERALAAVAGGQTAPARAPTSPGGSSSAPTASADEYLTLATIEQGMGVKVTDSKSWLQKTCADSRLTCSQDRVMLLGEPGFITDIDRSDNTAKVQWQSKSGFMPIACLVKCDDARRRSGATGSPDVSAMDLLRLLMAACGDASDLPEKPFDAVKGFHFHCDLKSIRVDAPKTSATCVAKVKATIVTEELLTCTQSGDFLVKVGSASKGIVFGVTGKTPNGYSNNLIGESSFEGTIGAMCSNIGGAVVHRGQHVNGAPAIKDGDVVGVKVRKGRLQLVRNGTAFFDFGVNGEFRCGVSLCEPGQTAALVASADGGRRANLGGEAGQLQPGHRVRLPLATDKRLKSMRVGWNANMQPHCGEVGEVQEVNRRSAKVTVAGKAYHWDIEVFDASQKRYCHNGCELRTHAVTGDDLILCNVCSSYQPRGSQTFRCEQHDYDMCEYCNGRPMLPSENSRVIRGPTWKWGTQDGTPYAEGTVRRTPADEEGWFTVEWDCGNSNRYRAPPFQDVILARENGLQGKQPVSRDHHGLGELVEALKVLGADGSKDCIHLPKTTYQAERGWHFYDRLKSIVVDDTKTVAVCKENRDATVVTEEVFEAEGSFTFTVKVCCAAGSTASTGPITVGVVDDNPVGFSTNTIGQASFKRCIGAMCMLEGGAIVHEGKIVGDAPGVGDGDVLGVRIEGGVCAWTHNGVRFHSAGLRGKFRFGVSLIRQGQSVEIEGTSAPGAEVVQSSAFLSLATVPKVAWGTQLKVQTADSREKLGAGAFGETWKATLTIQSKSQPVAVKLLKPERMTPELRKDFALEVSALAALTLPGGEPHPYLLQLIAIVPERYAIVTELCISDLKGYLETMRGELVAQVQVKLMQHVACGMAWLVERQYVHRDLKMQNILVAAGDVAKIADFGLARPMTDVEGQVAGTLLYMAPECFDGHFSQKSDVYSFSFIMLGTFNGAEVDVTDFMTARRILRGAGSDAVQMLLVAAIRRGDRPDIPQRVPERVAEHVRACWHGDPCKRPTFESISSDLRQLSTMPGFEVMEV